ncbi:OmpA family protein [Amycolatopsis anabasis]|uniref:OmpA family protein n=1 Tax=Amycolatopsis anabasis TaxID=1840409 RepID=UPI00131AC393|nr:OmpA family protein [Amycolatopsis anabasis]
MVRRSVFGVLVLPVVAVAALTGCDGDGTAVGGDGGSQPGTTSGLVVSPPAPPAPPSSASSVAPTPTPAGGGYNLQAKLDELLNGAPLRFDPDSVQLSEASKATIKQIAEAAHCPPGAKLEVIATARFEDGKKATEVSQQRADAVVQGLIAGGIAPERITAKGVGNEGIGGDDATLGVKIKVV